MLPRDSRAVRSIAPTSGSVIATRGVRNRLLRALLRDARAIATEGAEVMHGVPQGGVLYTSEMPTTVAYFPERAVIAITFLRDDGRKIETATVGHEGMVGLPLILGATTQVGSAVVQISGDIARIPIPLLVRALDEHPRWRAVVLAYSHVVLADLIQTQSCIRTHSAEQRVRAGYSPLAIGSVGTSFRLRWIGCTMPCASAPRERRRSSGTGTGTGLIRYHRRSVTMVEPPTLER